MKTEKKNSRTGGHFLTGFQNINQGQDKRSPVAIIK
jgi:hypothetical protein